MSIWMVTMVKDNDKHKQEDPLAISLQNANKVKDDMEHENVNYKW